MGSTPRQRRLSATDVAALGHCEIKVILDRQLGEVVTEVQAAARVRGNREHRRFDQLATSQHNLPRPEASPSPCFIATVVYGSDCWRTNELRSYRDRVLLPTPWGRGFVATYYRLSPPVARWLRKSPVATRFVRKALDVVRHIITAKEGRHDQQPL